MTAPTLSVGDTYGAITKLAIGSYTSPGTNALSVTGNAAISGTLASTGLITASSGANITCALTSNTSTTLYNGLSLYTGATSATSPLNITDASGPCLSFPNGTYLKTIGLSCGGASYATGALNDNSTKVWLKFYSGNIGNNTSCTIQACSISGGVSLAAAATAWTTVSDERLKDITGVYENPLEDIQKIRPAKFTWKKNPEAGNCVGVIAQSVQTVFPEAVGSFIDNDNGQEYLNAKYTELIPLLVAPVQALTTEIEALKALLAAK